MNKQQLKWDIETLEGTIGVIPYEEMERDALERVIAYLKQQLTDGWIPCKSKLPDKVHMKYLVTMKRHNWDVVAWQPLPEPYKELATDNNVVTKSGKDNNALTIGDKIRESNESLAEFIKTVTDKCIIGSCRTCPIYKACDQMENKEDLVKYFSQPYTK